MDQPLDSKEAMRKQVILELIQQMKEQLAPKGPGMLEISLEAKPLDEALENPIEESLESPEEEPKEEAMSLEQPMSPSKDSVIEKLKERQKMKGGY